MLVDYFLHRFSQQPVLILAPAPALFCDLVHNLQQYSLNLIQCLFFKNTPVNGLQVD
ncbi:hypothetical protein D3C87_2164690 [compost metagenome]